MVDGDDELGQLLHRYRRAAGLTQQQTVVATGIPQHRLSRIEGGLAIPTAEQINTLLDAYRVPAAERKPVVDRAAVLAERYRDERAGAVLLQRYETVKLRRRVWDAKRESAVVRCYGPAVLLGVLREQGAGTRRSSDEEAGIESMSAPADLDDPGTEWWLVQTEGALRGPVGSHAEHATLMEGVTRRSYQVNVHFGVVPLDVVRDAHGPRTGFVLFDDRAVLVQTDAGTALITDREQVGTYVEWWGRVESRAVFGDPARAVLARIAVRYRSR